MNEQDNSRQGFLSEKLGSFQADPPEKVWTAISARLGTGGRKRTIIIALSAAATIALAVTLGINFMERDHRESGVPQQVEKVSPEELTEPSEHLSALSESAAESEGGKQTEMATEPAAEARPGIAAGPEIGARTEIVAKPEMAAEPEIVAKSEMAYTDKRVQRKIVTALNRTPMYVEPVLPGISGKPEEQSIGLPGDTLVPSRLSPDEDLLFESYQETDQGRRDPRWMIGAALSPIYSFRDAEDQAMAVSSGYESGVISYAGGVHVSYRTTTRLAIESGVLFNKMGIDIGATGIQMYKQAFDFAPLREEASGSNILAISNSVGNIVSPSGDIYVNSYKVQEFTKAIASYQDNSGTETYADQGIRQHLDYLELPFNVRYSLIDRDIELQLVGGMSTNILLNSAVTMQTSSGNREIGYLTNIKNINYSGNAGVGMVYHVQDHLSLRLEPRFRYFINSINDQTLPSTRPYTFGIYTGLNFRF